MNKKISVKAMLRQVRHSEFVSHCQMPMGYTDGYPMLQSRLGKTYMIVPFLRFEVTGQVDKTLVYPIRYTVTVELSTGRVVGFQDLAADVRFRKIDFDKPIGLFRHDAIKSLSKQEYAQAKENLYGYYDRAVAGELDDEGAARMASLLKTLAEPCQMPIYKALAPDFYDLYLQ